MTRVPFAALAADHDASLGRIVARIEAVIAEQRFVLGAEVEGFEREAADYLGVSEAVGVSSGSDALVCALGALGVGPGDEVVVPAFSFFASAGSVARTGAHPRFADIDSATFNLDPASLAAAINPRTRAVIVVHLFGQAADMPALARAAAGVPLIEDAAQAFGARLDGKRLGGFGALGCFSFFPSKPLGAFGDAGLVVSNDGELASFCRRYRTHGALGKHEHEFVGANFRLDALQAAVLREKLVDLDGVLAARRERAGWYDAELAGISGVATPQVALGAESSYAQYTLRVAAGRRDALRAWLGEHGIESAVYYPKPLHLQPAFASLGYRVGAFPESERAAREVLSLPLYPSLSREQADRVIDAVRTFFTDASGSVAR